MTSTHIGRKLKLAIHTDKPSVTPRLDIPSELFEKARKALAKKFNTDPDIIPATLVFASAEKYVQDLISKLDKLGQKICKRGRPRRMAYETYAMLQGLSKEHGYHVIQLLKGCLTLMVEDISQEIDGQVNDLSNIIVPLPSS